MRMRILEQLTLEQKKRISDEYLSRPISRADFADEWGLSWECMNVITHMTDYTSLKKEENDD